MVEQNRSKIIDAPRLLAVHVIALKRRALETTVRLTLEIREILHTLSQRPSEDGNMIQLLPILPVAYELNDSTFWLRVRKVRIPVTALSFGFKNG